MSSNFDNTETGTLVGIVDEPIRVSIPDLTDAMHRALRLRFPAPEWLVAEEVPCASRRVDAVVVRMWADAVVHGFEVKASRADWLREAARPEKADVALPFVDYFYLVVADSTVAKPDEVPDHWGLLVLQKNGTLRASKPPTVLRPHLEGRRFWAAMIRRAWQASEDREFEKKIGAAHNEGYANGVKAGAERARRDVDADIETLEMAKQLREAYGWEIRSLIARAPELKGLLTEGRRKPQFTGLAEQLRRLATDLDGAAESVV